MNGPQLGDKVASAQDLRHGEASEGAVSVPTPSAARGRLATGAALVVAVGLMIALQLSRQAGVPPWRTVYAEDGTIFLGDAYRQPLDRVLFRSYFGYGHVVPRVLASVATDLPIERVPVFLSVVSALLVALLSCYIYFATDLLLDARWKRGLLACVPWLAPLAPFELIGTIANLHWFLLPSAAVALLDTSRRTSRVVLGCIVLVLTAVSDPLVVLVVPLALPGLLSAVRRGSTIRRLIALGGGLVVQLLVVESAPPGSVASTGVHRLFDVVGIRYAGDVLFGTRWADNLYRAFGTAYPWISLVALALLVGLKLAFVRRRELLTAGLLLVVSVIAFVVPVVLRGTDGFLSPTVGVINHGGSRYLMLPFVLLVIFFLLPQAVSTRVRSQRRRTAIVLPALLTLWIVAIALPAWRQTNLRSPGPTWSSALRDAAALCPAADSHGGASVDITPRPWQMTVACAHLASVAGAAGTSTGG
jgi:hypothetical protein